MLIPHQQRPFPENKNEAGEDLYLSGGTRRRTTTGEEELSAGSEQSDRLRNRRSRGGEGEKKAESRKQKGENGSPNLIRPIAAVPNDGF